MAAVLNGGLAQLTKYYKTLKLTTLMHSTLNKVQQIVVIEFNHKNKKCIIEKIGPKIFFWTCFCLSCDYAYHQALAHTQISTRFIPDFFNIIASALTVDPVVITSSIIAICCTDIGLTMENAFSMLCRRSLAVKEVWCGVSR